MDRSLSSEPNHPTAVRTAGSAAFELLLSAEAGERENTTPAPQAGPTLPEAPVLRQPQNGRRTESKSQAHPTPDAYPGHRSPLSKTEFEPPRCESPSLSLSAARHRYRTAQPSLEHRYYLHSHAWWLSLFGRGDGLVQPLCTQLGA